MIYWGAYFDEMRKISQAGAPSAFDAPSSGVGSSKGGASSGAALGKPLNMAAQAPGLSGGPQIPKPPGQAGGPPMPKPPGQTTPSLPRLGNPVRKASGPPSPPIATGAAPPASPPSVAPASPRAFGKIGPKVRPPPLSKLAWGDTYYHGAPASSEKSILRKGLRASMGGKGKGAVSHVRRAQVNLGPARPDDVLQAFNKGFLPRILERFEKNTKGVTTMSRSKNLSRVYGTATEPHRLQNIKDAYRSGGARSAVEKFLEYQPLEAKGVAQKLTRDPDHLLLGVQSSKDLPANLLRRSKPRRFSVGAVVRKVLARGKA